MSFLKTRRKKLEKKLIRMQKSLGNSKGKVCSRLSSRQKRFNKFLLVNLTLKMIVLVIGNMPRMKFCKYKRRSDFFIKIGLRTSGSRNKRRSMIEVSCLGLRVNQSSWFYRAGKGNWPTTPGRGHSELLLLEQVLMKVMVSASL